MHLQGFVLKMGRFSSGRASYAVGVQYCHHTYLCHQAAILALFAGSEG